MDRLKRAALVLRLIEELRGQGSWCGETHIQKSAYFLQELVQVPLEFDFILYKHGPFSFDLRDELTALRADELIELESHFPWGPRIAPMDRSGYIQGLYSKTLRIYEKQIVFVANALGGKGSADLERVGTALYLTLHQETGPTVENRSVRLTEIKPHIPLESAREAVGEVDEIFEQAEAHI